MQSIKNFVKEALSIAIFSLVIVLPIRFFIAQPFVVSGGSMDNTFASGNYLIVDEISYRFEEPKRGDVVIFQVPKDGLLLSNFKLDKKIYFIKRVIGLPGETVEINGDEVKIYNEANPEGMVLKEETYAFIDKLSPSYKNIKLSIKLESDEYFVMGDNRHNSSDSRFWGPIKKTDIKGRALVRLFPFTQISMFPGEYNNY